MQPSPRLSACPPSLARLAWLALLPLLGLPLSACAPRPSDPTDADPARERDQALAALQRSFGPVALRPHPRLGTPATLEFHSPARLPSGASPTSALRELILRHRPLFGLARGDTLDSETNTSDSLGMRHLSFTVQRDGISVWGSQITAHLDPSGRLVRLHGRLPPLVGLITANATPTWLPEAARQQALAAARDLASSLSARSPTLHYLPDGPVLRLVYRVELVGQQGNLPRHQAYFIDAHLGEVRLRLDLLAALDVTLPATGSGVGALGVPHPLAIAQRGDRYYLQDPTRGDARVTSTRPGERLPGRTVDSPLPDRWDSHTTARTAGLAVDVHAHLTTLWDYFASQHGHFGWDGRGHGIVGVTHFRDADSGPPDPPDLPALPATTTTRALFDGDRLFFADADGRDLAPLGAALDVVAHEYAHAVIRSLADLVRRDDSAAIDEGLADLFACLVEQSARPGRGNWTLGDEVYRPPSGPTALSDLTTPTRTGQIAHVRDLPPAIPATDNAAADDATQQALARRAAGLVSHAGYQMALRLGNDRTAAIAFRAVRHYLVSQPLFSDIAYAMCLAARDLYGPDLETQVRDAWRTVGLDPSPPPPAGP